MLNWILIIELIFNTVIFNFSNPPVSSITDSPDINSSQQQIVDDNNSNNQIISINLFSQSLAKCLTDKGAVMYGAYWCPHCAKQKELFGEDFQFIKYQECDPSGENGDPQLCQDAGVGAYPTWIDAQGNKLSGTQPLEILANWSNCNIN